MSAPRPCSFVVKGMDEGVKVQVDGRVVGYLDHNNLSPTGSRIQLFTASVPPNADGSHYVRVTNLNSCGHERPLELSLEDRKSVV